MMEFIQPGLCKYFKPMEFYFKVLTAEEASTYYISHTHAHSSLDGKQNEHLGNESDKLFLTTP